MTLEYVTCPRGGSKTEVKLRDYCEDTDLYKWFCHCGAFVEVRGKDVIDRTRTSIVSNLIQYLRNRKKRRHVD